MLKLSVFWPFQFRHITTQGVRNGLKLITCTYVLIARTICCTEFICWLRKQIFSLHYTVYKLRRWFFFHLIMFIVSKIY
jgi:hypothetical protein